MQYTRFGSPSSQIDNDNYISAVSAKTHKEWNDGKIGVACNRNFWKISKTGLILGH